MGRADRFRLPWWRVETLTAAGYSPEQAIRLGRDLEIEVPEAVEQLHAGVPPADATARILQPGKNVVQVGEQRERPPSGGPPPVFEPLKPATGTPRDKRYIRDEPRSMGHPAYLRARPVHRMNGTKRGCRHTAEDRNGAPAIAPKNDGCGVHHRRTNVYHV